MKKLPIYLFLLLLLTCAKEDSQNPNTPPIQITKQYTLTVSAGDGGSVSTAGGTFSQGTQVSITATPNSGYSFSGWSNGSTANPLTVTLNSNTTITANFQVIVNSYTLTVSAGEGGTVTGGGEYEEGTEVSITATPNEGYEFIGWSDGESSQSRVITLLEDTNLDALFERIPFVTLSERFSSINETTSWFKENYYFQNYTYINDSNYFKLRVDQTESFHWRPLSSSVRYADLNGDELVDMFVHMSKVDPSGFGTSGPGKYVIYSNVYRDDFDYQDPIVVESDLVFYGDIIIQDFDNDGINDILIGAYQDHNNKSLAKETLRILYFNSDFTFEEYSVGFRSNMHSLSAGDVNNDGLVDFVQIGYTGMDDFLFDANFPNTFINMGGRSNFNKIDLLYNEEEFKQDWDQFQLLYYDLFDLNNDGYLDIVAGFDLINDKWVELRSEYSDRFFHESMEGPFVLWGDGTGQYSIDDITYTENLSFPYDSEVGMVKIMGGGFTDFDNDGDIDFIISAELQDYDISREALTGRAYDNYIIQLYQNNGDKTFTDNTLQTIDSFTEFDPYEFSFFNRMSLIDKDGDGDFDIVPRSFNGVWNPYTQSWNDLADNLYWKNVGGQFKRNEN